MNTDDKDHIIEFEEKPKQPKSNNASMGVYIFTWDKLRKYLEQDEANPDSANDFGKNIIPAMLADGERLVAYPVRRILEGRRNHREPVGREYGPAEHSPCPLTCTTRNGASTPATSA